MTVLSEPRIPVTILTGFLGSGKTTLLNRILRESHGRRIAVIENEFGEIGIDDALVINAEEEIFEMNNGCICCTVRGDLIRILNNLLTYREKFDYILIETTGLADPAPVAQTFFMDETMQQHFRLDGIVTLVDARHLLQHLDTNRECHEQIAFADVLLLNKVDLIDDEAQADLALKIRRINALAPIHPVTQAQVPLDQVLDLDAFDLTHVLSKRPHFLDVERPYEWGGVFELPVGEYRLTLQDGPDPQMALALVPADTLAAVEDSVERCFHDFFCFQTPPGDTLIASTDNGYALTLEASGEKTFPVFIGTAGRYALFTEHHPDEFSLTLAPAVPQAGQTTVTPLAPLEAQDYAAAHTHDTSITSVGIECPGDVLADRFNYWLGTLLQVKGADLFRMKGIIAVEGEDRRFIFQGVHMLFEGEPGTPWGPDEPRTNRLIFIGRDLNRFDLKTGFELCLSNTLLPIAAE